MATLETNTTLHCRRVAELKNRESFEWLVQKYSPLLYASAYYRYRPRGGLKGHDDLVQDTWARFWHVVVRKDAPAPDGASRSVGSDRDLSNPTKVHAFLNTILRGLIVDEQRRADNSVSGDTASPVEPSTPRAEPDLSTVPDDTRGIITRVTAHENARTLMDALSKLSRVDQDLLLDHYVNHMSLRTIAQRLSISEPATKERAHAARVRLRGLLKSDPFDPD